MPARCLRAAAASRLLRRGFSAPQLECRVAAGLAQSPRRVLAGTCADLPALRVWIRPAAARAVHATDRPASAAEGHDSHFVIYRILPSQHDRAQHRACPGNVPAAELERTAERRLHRRERDRVHGGADAGLFGPRSHCPGAQVSFARSHTHAKPMQAQQAEGKGCDWWISGAWA